MKEQLAHLESLTAGTADFDKTIEAVMKHLHHHNDDEEIKDLPLLEPAIGPEASVTAGQHFKRTKQFVPTRYAIFSSHLVAQWMATYQRNV